MRKNTCRIVLFLLFFSLKIWSNPTFFIKGIVKDASTGEEIIGASIRIKEDGSRGTVTGLDGTFTLNNLNGSSVELMCSYIGYDPYTFSVSTLSSSTVEILLEPATLELSQVVVFADNSRNTEVSARNMEKQAMNVINVVSAKAIELSADLTVANVIQRVSGVTIERSSTGDGQYAILRGMDKRYNYTLVNGVKIPSPDNKNRFVPLDIFPSELLDRLEVTKALTADMEADGIGGAVNLVMKDAPSRRQFTFNISTGYNALFFNRDFQYFDKGLIDKKSPYERYGEGYPARVDDFTAENLKLKSRTVLPNLFAGISWGGRLFEQRLGYMLAGSFQNSYRGNNSLYYHSSTATSDASNLPVLTNQLNRTFSEQQTRYGLHLKLDFRISPDHKLDWYNGYMDFKNAQVRDNESIALTYGYDPEGGNYNVSYSTRMRMNHQSIYNSTLKGYHTFGDGALKVNWTGVWSEAFNETPDNVTVNTGGIASGNTVDIVSVNVSGGATRRWEHNSDKDKAGYMDLSYQLSAGEGRIDLSAGGMYRDKKRESFFDEYTFNPYDSSKPETGSTNLIKGIDWNSYDEILFRIHNPTGSTGDPLNYDASEKIAAAYLMGKYAKEKWQFTAGLRIEHTNQGYDLKHAVDGLQNSGKQEYTDWLPNFHLKYNVHTDANLKASYVKSINRPSFFEIVPYNIVNEEYTERGNPDLNHTVGHNVDFRYEYFPRASEQFMAGFFYKKILDPIEFGTITEGQGTFFMPVNFGNASNYGMELDIMKYVNRFGIKANYTFTNSTIKTTKLAKFENEDPDVTENIEIREVEQKRPLNGQAMHVANMTLLFKDIPRGWDAQLAFVYTGKRLYAVSRYLDDDIWQGAHVQMDLSIEKTFRSGVGLFFKATNLLNTPYKLYLKKINPSNEKVAGYETACGGTLLRKDRYGQNIQIGFRYKF